MIGIPGSHRTGSGTPDWLRDPRDRLRESRDQLQKHQKQLLKPKNNSKNPRALSGTPPGILDQLRVTREDAENPLAPDAVLIAKTTFFRNACSPLSKHCNEMFWRCVWARKNARKNARRLPRRMLGRLLGKCLGERSGECSGERSGDCSGGCFLIVCDWGLTSGPLVSLRGPVCFNWEP